MLRLFRILTLGLLTALTVAKVGAFALLGPYESWQVPAIGYNPRGFDIGGPHSLGDEFRWADGHISYAFDASFVNYFGTNGVRQINAAMKIINSLPAFSAITSADLQNTTKYPLVAWRYNGVARSLRLRDLKSTALSVVLEELGLADPERYTWTLRYRGTTLQNTTNYLVINRNYDPITFSPTPYVNGQRYTYQIQETANPAYADAVEISVDKSIPAFTSVAGSVLSLGTYFMNLTRDDVGGLRYLYEKFNQNVEGQAAAVNTFLLVTNFDNASIQTNYDLTLFSLQSLTNNAAQLTALYPGLVVTQTLTTLTPVLAVDSIYATNDFTAWSSAGAFFPTVLRTNFINSFAVVYFHKYANVFTNLASRTSTILYRDVSRVRAPFGSANNLNFVTNATIYEVATNLPAGSIYIASQILPGGRPDFSQYVLPAGVNQDQLTEADFANLNSLAQRLVDPQDPSSVFIRDNLSPETLTTLTNITLNGPEPAGFRATLAAELNSLGNSGLVFSDDVIAALVPQLRPETYLLYIQGAQGGDVQRLNRMLLEDAFNGDVRSMTLTLPLTQNVIYTTNILYSATNVFLGTSFQREQIITFNNILVPGFPITTVNITPALRGGVDKLVLTNVVYNDLNPGSFRYTNSYQIATITNGVVYVQTVTRVETQPDIVFSADDFGTDVDGLGPLTVRRSAGWIDGTTLNSLDPNKPALSGPGEIGPTIYISFSKIVPADLLLFPGDLSELGTFNRGIGVWGSFDGTTNAPTVYPKDISLEFLETKLFQHR